jgi:hypothetical protein
LSLSRICRVFAASLALLAGAVVPCGAAGQIHQSGEYSFSVGPPPAFVQTAELPDAWPHSRDDEDSGARVWLMDTQVDRRRGRHVFVDYAYEAVRQELVGEAAKFQIDFSPEFESLTIHAVELRRDGRWSTRFEPEAVTLARREVDFERDMATGTVTALLVLDDVRAGDVIRVRYSIDGMNPILAGQLTEQAGFGWVQPQLRRRLRVLYPPGTELVEHNDPGTPAARFETRADARVAEFDQQRPVVLRDEGQYPAWFSVVPSVRIDAKREWTDVARWARELYPPPPPLPASLRERIAQWRTLPDVDARIGAALRAVQEEVRYFGVEIGASTHRPAEPGVTWDRRYGDCKDKARLLVSVLDQLGVQAAPALVSFGRGRAVREVPPSASAFDHVIVQVRLGKDVVWVDPTSTQQRGSPRRMTIGEFGHALPVAADTRDLVPVQRAPGATSRAHVMEHFTPGEGEAAELRVESEFEGGAADRQRRLFQSQGKDEIARQYLEHYRHRFGEVSSGAKLEVEDREAENRVIVRERYLLASPWKAIAGAQRVLELNSESIASLVQLPAVLDRRAPLPLEHPVELAYVTRIDMPERWRWSNPIDAVTLQDDAIRYEASATLKDRRIDIRHQIRSASDAVAVADLGEHFRVRRAIAEDLGTRVLLELPAAAAVAEREQRINSLVRGLLDKRTRGKGSER